MRGRWWRPDGRSVPGSRRVVGAGVGGRGTRFWWTRRCGTTSRRWGWKARRCEREWLANRLSLAGVFDLVLEVDDSGLYHFHDSARELVDLGVLVRLLAERGASPDDVVRLIVPDGARFGALMTALANFRQRPVLVAPAGADLAVAPLSRANPQGLDIAPTSQARPEVPWQVIWPSQSWDYRHGREMVENDVWFGDAFMVGLRVGPAGLMLLYNGDGGGFAVQRPEPGHLVALGWAGESIVLVTERWPGLEVELRLQALSRALGADTFYRLPQALTGTGIGAAGARLHLLATEPGLFDLVVRRDANGEPGFPVRPGRFVGLRSEDVEDLPGAEIRLVIAGGQRVREVAADLASGLGRPVWIAPPGAVVHTTDAGRLYAEDRRRRRVSWEEIAPGPVRNPAPAWYETGSGLFEPRQGTVIVPFRHGQTGRIYGIIAPGQWRYQELRFGRQLLPPQSPELYFAQLAIGLGEPGPSGRREPVFSVSRFDGSVESSPLAELPRLLEAHGWMPRQDIVLAADFTDASGRALVISSGGRSPLRWPGSPSNENVTVWFPSRGSACRTAVRGRVRRCRGPRSALGPAGPAGSCGRVHRGPGWPAARAGRHRARVLGALWERAGPGGRAAGGGGVADGCDDDRPRGGL